jgi:hypothetical protein
VAAAPAKMTAAFSAMSRRAMTAFAVLPNAITPWFCNTISFGTPPWSRR